MSLAMLEGRACASLARAYRRVPNVPGEPPGEDRIVLGGISWEQYLAIDDERGADNSHPRFYYLDGELEIMTTSVRHATLKDWIVWLLLQYFTHHDLEIFTHGQATMQRLGSAGAEPDASWCFHQEKETPDLVLEVALTSGGLPKLLVYQRFAIPEVWFWRQGQLEIWNLQTDGSAYHGPVRVSRCLPELDVALLERCLPLPTWREAQRTFRDGLRDSRQDQPA